MTKSLTHDEFSDKLDKLMLERGIALVRFYTQFKKAFDELGLSFFNFIDFGILSDTETMRSVREDILYG